MLIDITHDEHLLILMHRQLLLSAESISTISDNVNHSRNVSTPKRIDKMSSASVRSRLAISLSVLPRR